MDKLEARNIFPDVASRDEFISRLRSPNNEALVEMGVRLSTQIGSIVSNTLTNSFSTTSAPPQQNAPVAPGGGGGGGLQPHKTTWPELKNTPAAEALRVIAAHRPDVSVVLVPQVHGGESVCVCVRVRLMYPATVMYSACCALFL